MLCLIIGGYWDIFDGNIMMRYPFFDIYNFYPFDYVCKYNGIMYIYIYIYSRLIKRWIWGFMRPCL